MTLDDFEPILVEAVKRQFEQSEFGRVTVHANRICGQLAVLAIWRVLRRAYVSDEEFMELGQVNDGQSLSVSVLVSAEEIKDARYPELLAKTKAWKLIDDLRSGLIADFKSCAEREKEAA